MPEVAAVGAVAVRAGMLLVVRRGHPPEAGKWTLPGGRVEPGESDAEALAREMREETGLLVRVGALVGEVMRPGADDGRNTTYRIRDYLVEIVDGTLRAGDDAADVEWVRLDQLCDLELTAGLLDTLRSWAVLP